MDHKIQAFSLQNQSLALGVSGGADSIALFWVFLDLFKRKKFFDLVIFHINFGFRGTESDLDQAFVETICHQEGVACEVFRPEPASIQNRHISLQEFAREFRMTVQDAFITKGFNIALAHNADDVTENILMRLARGSAPENAAGMSYFDCRVFRPLLGITRTDIRDRLSAFGKVWREDSSNLTNKYTRNLIRHEVVPVLESLYPGSVKRISEAFLALADSSKPTTPDLGNRKMPLSCVMERAHEVVSRDIHEFLTQIYSGRSPVPRGVVHQIAKASLRLSSGLDGESRVFHIPGGLSLKVSTTELHVFQRE